MNTKHAALLAIGIIVLIIVIAVTVFMLKPKNSEKNEPQPQSQPKPSPSESVPKSSPPEIPRPSAEAGFARPKPKNPSIPPQHQHQHQHRHQPSHSERSMGDVSDGEGMSSIEDDGNASDGFYDSEREAVLQRKSRGSTKNPINPSIGPSMSSPMMLDHRAEPQTLLPEGPEGDWAPPPNLNDTYKPIFPIQPPSSINPPKGSDQGREGQYQTLGLTYARPNI